jgi:hypothetical protein
MSTQTDTLHQPGCERPMVHRELMLVENARSDGQNMWSWGDLCRGCCGFQELTEPVLSKDGIPPMPTGPMSR